MREFNEIGPWLKFDALSCAGHFHDVYILFHGVFFALLLNETPLFNRKLFQFSVWLWLFRSKCGMLMGVRRLYMSCMIVELIYGSFGAMDNLMTQQFAF